MANLQYGDTIKNLPSTTVYVTSITDVVPVKFDSINEEWTVVAQKDATHMLIAMITESDVEHIMIEIGKCENLYLLADAIVD